MDIHAPLKFKSGINPEPDETKQNTRHIIAGNNIRFYRGGVQKIGGNAKEQVNQTASGYTRSLFSLEIGNNKWQIIGTHSKLYAKLGATVTNITPLQTTSTAIANSIDTTDTLNTIVVDATAHGMAAGDRVKISGAADVGGFTANTHINKEHIITSVTTDTFTLTLGTVATSTVANGGGASTVFFKEILAGEISARAASGPWIGIPWSTTPPWAAGTDASLIVQPRIWWNDAYGDTWVGGPGQGGKCYQWLGNTDTAPTVISNAPNADWGWIEDAKLVTLLNNTVANSKAGDLTAWTPAADSAAYSDAKEDAIELISQSQSGGENLIYAKESKIFRMRYVGGTVKWVWELVSDTIGIVSPYGRIVIGGIHYIFGKDNFYYYNGGIFSPLPNNTLLQYVFDDINLAQGYKFFTSYNQQYNEVHFHYCSAASDEPDRRVIFSISEGHWSIANITRSASDTSGKIFDYDILAHPTLGTYQHETGVNDDTSAMNSYVQVNFETIQNGKYETFISGMEPDLILEGNMTIALLGKDRARETETTLATFTVTESTTIIECEHEARWRSWKFTSNELGGDFRLGGMREIIQRGGEF